MKVVSTNIGNKVSFEWNGKIVETGIFKKPVSTSIFLGETDVVNDNVCDREHHSGLDKACFFMEPTIILFGKKNILN